MPDPVRKILDELVETWKQTGEAMLTNPPHPLDVGMGASYCVCSEQLRRVVAEAYGE